MGTFLISVGRQQAAINHEMRNVPISVQAELAARCRDYPSSLHDSTRVPAMAAEPKWQRDFSDHPDEWTDEDEMEWQ